MRIRLAFTDDHCSPDQMPYLVATVDEYTEDEWGGIPDFYKEDIAKYKNVREVNVTIRDDDVRELFGVSTIDARIEGDNSCYECGHPVDRTSGEQHGRAGWVHFACMTWARP